MRGRLSARRCDGVADRNTPAYAGKTPSGQKPAPLRQKHPRVCGEDFLFSSRSTSRAETPPRMRGRPERQQQSLILLGNTPAYAGKTSPLDPGSALRRKHPRVCGEDSMVLISTLVPLKHPRVCGEDERRKLRQGRRNETPPRMRGRHSSVVIGSIQTRNTPAYAGKTKVYTRRGDTFEKHPRVCGEDRKCSPTAVIRLETPPRMRGRLQSQ